MRSQPSRLPYAKDCRWISTTTLSKESEFVFFDQIVLLDGRTPQLLLSVFVDPSRKGHLEELTGAALQVDFDSGMMMDSLSKGKPIGFLSESWSHCSSVKLKLQIEQHGLVSIPEFAIVDPSGERKSESIMLPAFKSGPETHLSFLFGYCNDRLSAPRLGETNVCVWPEDTDKR